MSKEEQSFTQGIEYVQSGTYTNNELEKLNSRPGFIYPHSIFTLLGMMESSSEGEVSRAIRRYVSTGEIATFHKKSLHYGALYSFIFHYDKDAKKYLKMCVQNAINRNSGKNNDGV